MGVPDHLSNILKQNMSLVIRSNDVSIRDIGKIVSTINLLSVGARKNTDIPRGWLEVLITLVVVKTVRPDLYVCFRDANISDMQILEYLGANIEDLEPKRGGARNEVFDREVYYFYWIWIFLTGSPLFQEIEEQLAGMIARSFDSFGDPDNPSGIPQRVERDWIDVFSFYGNE